MALVTPAVLAFGLGSPAALAQDAAQPPVPELNAQLYRIPIDAERTLWTDDSGMARSPRARSWASSTRATRWSTATTAPTRSACSRTSSRPISSAPGPSGACGWAWTAALPASASEVAAGGGGLGIAVDLKGTILSAGGRPLGFALGTRFGLPTSTVAAPWGAGLTWTLQGIVDYEAGPVLLAANLGTVVNPDDPRAGHLRPAAVPPGCGLRPRGAVRAVGGPRGRVSYQGDVGPGGAPASCLRRLGAVLRGLGHPRRCGHGHQPGIGAPTLRLVASVGCKPGAHRPGRRRGGGSARCLRHRARGSRRLAGRRRCPDPSVRLTGMVVDYGGAGPDALVRLTVEDDVATLGGNFTRDAPAAGR